MVQNTRRHKRFKLDAIEINGKMVMAQKFEIVDISAGGVCLKTDRRLNVGKEYLIKLANKKKSIDVKGMVIRCELSNIEEGIDGEGVSIYSAAMMFNDVPPNTVADFIDSSEQKKKEIKSTMADRRLHVRFYIVTSGDTTLRFPAEFKVKEISLSGMLMQTDQALGIESRIPMGLSLQEDDKPINFTGRVVSCRMKDQTQPSYVIGIEFVELGDNDKTVLQTFIEYLTTLEQKSGKTGN